MRTIIVFFLPFQAKQRRTLACFSTEGWPVIMVMVVIIMSLVMIIMRMTDNHNGKLNIWPFPRAVAFLSPCDLSCFQPAAKIIVIVAVVVVLLLSTWSMLPSIWTLFSSVLLLSLSSSSSSSSSFSWLWSSSSSSSGPRKCDRQGLPVLSVPPPKCPPSKNEWWTGDDGNDDGEESDDGDDDGEDDVDHHLKGKEKEKGNTPGLGETRTS